MIICPHCGHVNPDARILCTNCYKPLRPEERRWMGLFYIVAGVLAIAADSQFDLNHIPWLLTVAGVVAIIYVSPTLHRAALSGC